MPVDKPSSTFLSGRTYDALKFVALILLPALGAFYFALSTIWGLPKGEEVIGTITSLDVFLGLLLGLSTAKYNNSEAKYDGVIEVEEHADGSSTANMVLLHHEDPTDIVKMKEVVFKVEPPK